MVFSYIIKNSVGRLIKFGIFPLAYYYKYFFKNYLLPKDKSASQF